MRKPSTGQNSWPKRLIGFKKKLTQHRDQRLELGRRAGTGQSHHERLEVSQLNNYLLNNVLLIVSKA